MAGAFEVFTDSESRVRFALVAPDGSVLAVSGPYTDKREAAAAIKDVRECAGTGLIHDLCPAHA
ncbi:YegP family protein [Pseudarthrobacter sp. RMG13]|uniref:YegP family protein n=1 Tax=Pseudarthrobacter humi TaxID=2952523 RepID=A0ABT1LQD2_9MICC|nr:YegP family protein [Pseudarthrobacter humi]MCP8999381.1 YegP family protein [Pseudarthrobacter humi]